MAFSGPDLLRRCTFLSFCLFLCLLSGRWPRTASRFGHCRSSLMMSQLTSSKVKLWPHRKPGRQTRKLLNSRAIRGDQTFAALLVWDPEAEMQCVWPPACCQVSTSILKPEHFYLGNNNNKVWWVELLLFCRYFLFTQRKQQWRNCRNKSPPRHH